MKSVEHDQTSLRRSRAPCPGKRPGQQAVDKGCPGDVQQRAGQPLICGLRRSSMAHSCQLAGMAHRDDRQIDPS